MRVIARGTPEAEKRYRVVCHDCKSTIEYSHKEITKITSCQREGPTHYLGMCPVCLKQLIYYSPQPLPLTDAAYYRED